MLDARAPPPSGHLSQNAFNNWQHKACSPGLLHATKSDLSTSQQMLLDRGRHRQVKCLAIRCFFLGTCILPCRCRSLIWTRMLRSLVGAFGDSYHEPCCSSSSNFRAQPS